MSKLLLGSLLLLLIFGIAMGYRSWREALKDAARYEASADSLRAVVEERERRIAEVDVNAREEIRKANSIRFASERAANHFRDSVQTLGELLAEEIPTDLGPMLEELRTIARAEADNLRAALAQADTIIAVKDVQIAERDSLISAMRDFRAAQDSLVAALRKAAIPGPTGINLLGRLPRWLQPIAKTAACGSLAYLGAQDRLETGLAAGAGCALGAFAF